MTEPRVVRRRVRYQSSDGSVNVAGDVNIVASTGGSASSHQRVRVVQNGDAQAGTAPDTGGSAASTEEDA